MFFVEQGFADACFFDFCRHTSFSENAGYRLPSVGSAGRLN